MVHLILTPSPAMPSTVKGAVETPDVGVLELTEVTPGAEDVKLGTQFDQRDMVRMGKKQELKRQFQFFRCVCSRMQVCCPMPTAITSPTEPDCVYTRPLCVTASTG